MNASSWLFHAASAAVFLLVAFELLRLQRERTELMEVVVPVLAGVLSRSQAARVANWLAKQLPQRLGVKSCRIEFGTQPPDAWRMLVRVALGKAQSEDTFLLPDGNLVPAAEFAQHKSGHSSIRLREVRSVGERGPYWVLEENADANT